MKRVIDQSLQARRQLREQAQYVVEQGQPEAAVRLIERYVALLGDLIQHPLSGHPYESSDPQLREIRVQKIRGYPLLIYYQLDEPVIRVAAVLHGSRSERFVKTALRSQR